MNYRSRSLSGLWKANVNYIYIIETVLGEDHPDVAQSLNNLAELYRSQGRYESAEPLYLQALAIAEATLGENHPNTKTIRDNLNFRR
ncbi:MAG: tetratricopeptide repeat protein [Waterburya sp.]